MIRGYNFGENWIFVCVRYKKDGIDVENQNRPMLEIAELFLNNINHSTATILVGHVFLSSRNLYCLAIPGLL